MWESAGHHHTPGLRIQSVNQCCREDEKEEAEKRPFVLARKGSLETRLRPESVKYRGQEPGWEGARSELEERSSVHVGCRLHAQQVLK